jgi:hypothetical protein
MGVLEMNQIIIDAVNDTKNSNWISSLIHGTEKSEQWLSIVRLPEDEIILGFSKSGYWIIDRNEYIHILREGSNLRDLLPILKKPISEVNYLITEELLKKGFSADLCETFPFLDLTLAGLKSKSDFWASLAIDWIEKFSSDEAVKIELNQVFESKWASQRTKQKANKILKNWSRILAQA